MRGFWVFMVLHASAWLKATSGRARQPLLTAASALTLTTPDLIGLTLGRVGSRTHPYALSCLSARRAVAAAQQQYPRAGGLGNMRGMDAAHKASEVLQPATCQQGRCILACRTCILMDEGAYSQAHAHTTNTARVQAQFTPPQLPCPAPHLQSSGRARRSRARRALAGSSARPPC